MSIGFIITSINGISERHFIEGSYGACFDISLHKGNVKRLVQRANDAVHEHIMNST